MPRRWIFRECICFFKFRGMVRPKLYTIQRLKKDALPYVKLLWGNVLHKYHLTRSSDCGDRSWMHQPKNGMINRIVSVLQEKADVCMAYIASIEEARTIN